MRKNRKTFYIALLYTMCLLLVNCSNGAKENESKDSQDEQKKDIAEILVQIDDDTETLIQDLWLKKEQPESPAQTDKDVSEEGQDDISEKDDNKEPGGNGEGQDKSKESEDNEEDQDKSQEEDDSQEEEKEDESKLRNWNEIYDIIEKLHLDWNTYEPEARRDGATDEMLNTVKEQLNILGENIGSEDIDVLLQETTKLQTHYPAFLNLYKHNAPPEIKMLKALTRQIVLHAQSDKWSNIDGILDEMDNTWLTAKARMEHVDVELNERIGYAIADLSRASKQESFALVNLKGDILIYNLDQVK